MVTSLGLARGDRLGPGGRKASCKTSCAARACRCWGQRALGDRLEGDRAFGQEVRRAAGMRVAPTYELTSFADAMGLVRRRPGRYVYKPSGAGFAAVRTYVGEVDDGADLIAYLESGVR